ncbi:MAG: AraC family transcriptional regulator [Candidatus Choladocola sp.]|nr:AraC family transcriptional regulator [Candidatus Choladocola sp.]
MRSKEPNVSPSSDYYLYQPSTVASRIYLYPIVTGYFYYEAGYHQRRSSYDSFLLMHVIRGTCHVRLNGQTRFVMQDQFLLLDCYEPHEYWYTSDSEVSWLHFDGPLARDYYELITSSHGNILSTANAYSIEHGMAKILRMFRNSEPIRESAVSASITKMLTELLNTRSDAGGSFSHAQIVENSVAYINEHFREPLSLDVLARNSNMSQFHFTRVFTAETGYTPHQYLIATRINYAKFLLKTSDIPVKEIAFNSGFNSESGFCSSFRKREKMTPGEYRSFEKGTVI